MTAPHDRTADQFDAWLETAAKRDSRPTSPNGATDPAAHDLVTTAHEFHASIRAAEQRAVPAIPAKAIWEDVMSSTTTGTISIPALAPSGADAPPNGPTRPISDSPWPKPGHWAVPAFLVVAMMIGILWFYSSFFGASTTPEQTPTLQPGFAFSTPTDDIDEWLVAPDDVDCGSFGTPDPNSQGFDLGQNTSADIDVDAYLPFEEAPALQQRQIAERYLYLVVDCPRATTDPGVTSDVFMMPFEYATNDQIAAAQQISAALPNQDYRDYFIVQPILDNSGGDSYLGRTVVLPGDVIQLADGRLGVPTRIHLARQASVLDMTDGIEFAPSTFQVFERVDGHWLVDEIIQVCIGDCDAFWAELAGDTPLSATPSASPVASPDIATPSASLQPITASECTVEGLSQEEVSTIIRNAPESPSRTWIPVGPVDPATAAQISQIDRAWQACDAFGSTGQQTVLQTANLTSTGPEALFPDHIASAEAYLLGLQRFDERRALGDSILASMDAYVTTAQAIVDIYGLGDTLPVDQRISVPVIDAAILLADGRTALPIVDPHLLFSWEAALERGTYQFVYMPVHILALDPDSSAWLVDEVIFVCVGDCDEAREIIVQFGETNGINVPSTPAASLVTTNATPASAVQPITPGECTVEGLSQEEVTAIIRNTTDPLDRSWVPVGPVDPATAHLVSQVDRAWQACDAFGSIGQRTVLQTDHLTTHGPEIQGLEYARTDDAVRLWFERFDQRRDLGDAFTASMETYLTMTDLVVDSHGTGSDTIPSDQRLSLPVADTAMLLADGRIALAIVDPFLISIWEQSQAPDSQFPFVYMPVHILAHDSEADAWLVDEVFWLCVGDCDTARDRATEFLEYAGSYGSDLLGTPAASPVTTPSGIDDALLDPGECTVTPLTTDEISALQQDPGSYPDRLYGPTSPVDDALAVHIAEIDREFLACANEGNWRSMASQRLIHEALATGSYAQTSFASSALSQGMSAEEYIAWHRDLSATLLPGTLTDYVVTSDRDITTTTGRVVQPHQVVQLADGRIGAPQSAVLPPDNDIGGAIPLIAVPFNIFIQESDENDRWVLDELLLLCVGDCDMFYEQMARDLSVLPITTPSPSASPAATPASDDNTEWLVNPDDIACDRNAEPLPDTLPVSEGAPAIGDYLPFTEASSDTQVAVARQFQLLSANCAPGPDGMPAISEDISVIPNSSEGPMTREQLDLAIALSDAISTGDPLEFVIEAEPGLVPSNGFETVTASLGIMFPESVVQLPDGRFGVPLHTAIETTDPDGAHGLIAEQGALITPFLIFTLENGEPRLDEVIWLCLGDCDDYWASYEIIDSPVATPAASPAASPASDEFWLEPLSAGDCTVEPVPYVGTGEIITQRVPTRDHIYLPLTDADATTALQVSQTARAWIACVRYTDDWNLRLQTENLNLEPGNALASWDYVTLSTFPNHVDAYRQLSDQVIDPNPETYWVEAPTDDFWRNNPQMPVTQTILPSQLVTLPDGRVGGPLSWLIPPGSEPIMPDGPFQIIPFVILAPDPGNDGHWLVDELIPLCSGDCETFWDDPHAAFIAAGIMREGDLTPPTPPSTPISTPADARKIRFR